MSHSVLKKYTLKYAILGNLEAIRTLYRRGDLDITLRDTNRRNIFIMACEHGHIDLVRFLAEKVGMDPQERARHETTPFYLACCHNHLEVVQYLYEVHRVDAMCLNEDRCTPLHIACRNGRIDIVKYLHKIVGVDMNPPKRGGATPLYIACEYGHLQIVQYLCEVAHIDPFISINGYGLLLTPLSIACRAGRLQIIRYLIEVVGVPTQISYSAYTRSILTSICSQRCNDSSTEVSISVLIYLVEIAHLIYNPESVNWIELENDCIRQLQYDALKYLDQVHCVYTQKDIFLCTLRIQRAHSDKSTSARLWSCMPFNVFDMALTQSLLRNENS